MSEDRSKLLEIGQGDGACKQVARAVSEEKLPVPYELKRSKTG